MDGGEGIARRCHHEITVYNGYLLVRPLACVAILYTAQAAELRIYTRYKPLFGHLYTSLKGLRRICHILSVYLGGLYTAQAAELRIYTRYKPLFRRLIVNYL